MRADGRTSAASPLGSDASPWWRNSVIYQIYPLSYADSDGDGVGDLRGIIEHVDHLAELGVGAVWLCPVYPSPHEDNGYDIADYLGIDPRFGTLEDFDDLVEALRTRGIRLIMDLVVNHTSDEHPWFAESRASLTSARRDWYIWRPARPGHEPGQPGAEPNNWESYFGGSAWAHDDETDEYYLHLFSAKQPDLNWENPEVRAAVHDVMRWWIERGVDGFRMDVINLISKDPAMPDGEPWSRGSRFGDGRPHFVCGPRLHEFLHELRAATAAGRIIPLLVGETPSIDHEQGRLLTEPTRGELDMVFQFEHVELDHGASKWDPRPIDLRELKSSFARWQHGLGDGWNSLYWDNHDQPRAVSRFGDDDPRFRDLSAKLLAAVLHLHRGTPYVYQGEELGMTNVPFDSIGQLRDLDSVRHHRAAIAAGTPEPVILQSLRDKSRDNARTPMHWSAGPNAGFTTGVPWIPVNPNHAVIHAAAQRADPGSVFHFYRQLIALRDDEPAVVEGAFELLLAEDRRVWAFTRTTADVELLVLANLSREDVLPDLDLRPWVEAPVILGNYEDGEAPGHGLRLRPWEVLVLRRETSHGLTHRGATAHARRS